MELILSVYIISVRALSCGHCHGCLHLLESPLFAGEWPHQFPKAPKGEVFLFSHSPVPFLGLQLLAGLLLLSSTSFFCSGTRLSPLTKKKNKRARKKCKRVRERERKSKEHQSRQSRHSTEARGPETGQREIHPGANIPGGPVSEYRYLVGIFLQGWSKVVIFLHFLFCFFPEPMLGTTYSSCLKRCLI